MLLEAVDCPIRYEWPEGEVRLTPGQPVLVSSDRGLKILKKCGSKVRVVEPLSQQWLSAWRELAQATNGITKTDPRFKRIMNLLNLCDSAFEKDDWNTFCRINDQIKEILDP